MTESRSSGNKYACSVDLLFVCVTLDTLSFSINGSCRLDGFPAKNHDDRPRISVVDSTLNESKGCFSQCRCIRGYQVVVVLPSFHLCGA